MYEGFTKVDLLKFIRKHGLENYIPVLGEDCNSYDRNFLANVSPTNSKIFFTCESLTLVLQICGAGAPEDFDAYVIKTLKTRKEKRNKDQGLTLNVSQEFIEAV